MHDHTSPGPALVTGATGFIGRRLVARLLAGGRAVRALALPGEPVERCWPGPVEVFRGDVRDRTAVEAAVMGAGVVLHLAAVVGDWGRESLYQAVTVEGTRNVLGAAAAAGVRAVLVSSVTVYGDAIGSDVCDEDHPFGRPQGPYGRAKQAQERIARELEAAAGLRVTIVRPTNVYGPGSRPWVDDLSDHLRRGLPSLFGDGEQNAGLAYVDNVADLLALAAYHPAAVGRVYNASDDLDVSWRRYFTDLTTAIGAPPPRAIPAPLARAGAVLNEALWRLLGIWESRPPITREAVNLVGSHHRVPGARARAELGWAPQVSYDEGLAAVLAYLGGAGAAKG